MNPLCLLVLFMTFFQAQQTVLPSDGVNLALPQDFVTNPAGIASFELDWPEAPIPHWFIEMAEDGKGRYDLLADGEKPSAQTMRPIAISEPVQQRLRGGYKAVLDGRCETKTKHLANTGAKHIAYTMLHSDAWSSCTFNYSDDKALMDSVAGFQAIAETIQIGIRLQQLHRFDRLGLDAEIDRLDAEQKDGRAIEMQNIAPILQSIVDDERVIERARRKAARLVQSSSSAPAPAR